MARTTRGGVALAGALGALVAVTGCSGAAPVAEVLSPLEELAPPPGWVLGDSAALGLEDGEYSRMGDVVVTEEAEPRALVGYVSDRVSPEGLPEQCEAAAAWMSAAAELLGDPDLSEQPDPARSLDALVGECSASGSDGGGITVSGTGGPGWSYRGRDVAVYLEVESTDGFTPTPHLVRAFVSAD